MRKLEKEPHSEANPLEYAIHSIFIQNIHYR